MKIILATCTLLLSFAGTFGQTGNPGLKIIPLTDRLYVYTTYRAVNGTPFPSNSLYLVTDIGVVLFDTPWDSTQFQPLLDSISVRHKKKVIYSISTHYHDDRTAGVEFLKAHGVKTYSSKMTYDLCLEYNNPQPENYFLQDTKFVVGGYPFETFYPGEGHTKDNIAVWFEREKILYGGCLVKSTENQDLGNIADANLEEWGRTIEKLVKKYPGHRFVIPGHFGWESNEALEHTLELLKINTEKHRR